MALPPNIPTSFMPNSAQNAPRRFKSTGDIAGAFGFLAYGALALVVVLAFGLFVYERVLVATLAAEDKALAQAQASIDPETVQGFVRLQDRLSSSDVLLGRHLQLSNFFGALETVLPSPVSLSTLSLTLDPTGTPKVSATGVAKNFNALAAASNAFADDRRIKNAIFAQITINPDHTVGFSLTAALDPRLVAFDPATAPSAATASSTEPSAESAAESAAATSTTP
jgi:hypothetical protein